MSMYCNGAHSQLFCVYTNLPNLSLMLIVTFNESDQQQQQKQPSNKTNDQTFST